MGIRAEEWALFVQAGMNDIDLRCDSYLAWLDDKRRSRELILKKLLALSGATAGIVARAKPGIRTVEPQGAVVRGEDL